MAEKSVFDKITKYELDACIFCKKLGSIKVSQVFETLIAITDHLNFKTYTFRVGIRTFDLRNVVKHTPSGEKIIYSGQIAPNRFDVVFALDRGKEGSLNLIYHITDCYAGWLFAVPYTHDSVKRNRSLDNPAYKRHHDRIWTTSSVDNFARFLAIGTVGFALLCFKCRLVDKALIEKLLLRSITEMRSKMKNMIYWNLGKDERTSTPLGNIFSNQLENAMYWPVFRLKNKCSIDELVSDFEINSSRYKASFKYLGHYIFGQTQYYLEKPLISEPFGPLKK